jgi:hypothetical protein
MGTKKIRRCSDAVARSANHDVPDGKQGECVVEQTLVVDQALRGSGVGEIKMEAKRIGPRIGVSRSLPLCRT